MLPLDPDPVASVVVLPWYHIHPSAGAGGLGAGDMTNWY